jgi:hypothetical protein
MLHIALDGMHSGGRRKNAGKPGMHVASRQITKYILPKEEIPTGATTRVKEAHEVRLL